MFDDWVADDTTGELDNVHIEVPKDMADRVFKIWKEEFKSATEIQVHLVGRRRMEGDKHIITVLEMIVPLQHGTVHKCNILDNDFLDKIEHTHYVGMCHIHMVQQGRPIFLSCSGSHQKENWLHEN